MFLTCETKYLFRKRPVDVAVAEYDAAMSNVFQVLMNISQQFLTRSGTQPSAIDESEYEFAACICETMVALGSSNMQCILADGSRTLHFLKQVSIPKHFSYVVLCTSSF
jgi:exportin-5